MKRHPTTQASPIRQLIAFLVAVLVFIPAAARAQTPCEDQCAADRDAANAQCYSTWVACYAAAGGDLDLQAACDDDLVACYAAADAAYNACVAACNALPCSEQCYADYNALVAQIEQNYQSCVQSAGGDPDISQVCADQRAAALALAASQLQTCLAACPPTATEPSSWGAVKGLFR